jgi:hypothetical protein
METGVGLIWADRDWRQVSCFAPTSSNPEVAFIRTGHIAVADPERLQVFSIQNREAVSLHIEASFAPKLALFDGPNVDQFRVVQEHEVLTCRLVA